MMRTTSENSTLVLVLLLSVPCVAWTAHPSVFSIHDTNADGYLERDEYAVFLSRLWARRAHLMPHPPLRPPLVFDTIDSNADGRISEEELLNSLEGRLRHRHWRGGRLD